MSRKALIWLLFFSIILNISTIVTFSYYRWFQHDRPSIPKEYAKDQSDSDRRQSFESKLAKDLNLTPQQTEQMNALRSEFFKGFKTLMTELRDERREFTELLKQDTLDTLKINEKIESISTVQKQIQFYSMKNLMKHRAILNDEQWNKFKSTFAKMMIGGDHRKNHRSGPERQEDGGAPPADSSKQQRPE
ncbi:MAG: Spy/CpxP family protein refolding chaperone [Candidatus Zhuqueibacterota bacterium]